MSPWRRALWVALSTVARLLKAGVVRFATSSFLQKVALCRDAGLVGCKSKKKEVRCAAHFDRTPDQAADLSLRSAS